MIILNEDNDHFFKKAPELMTRRGLEDYIDSYKDTCITHIFFCAAGQRTSYQSKVWDTITDPQPSGKMSTFIWAQNAKRLFDAGIDPYKVWIDRCRQDGISPWMSMRPNDMHQIHWLVKDNYRTARFVYRHAELWNVPPQPGVNPDLYFGRMLNFSKPEVQEYTLSVIREILENYPADGLEIDWMRRPRCLPLGRERELAYRMTDFMKEVRAIARRVGQKICVRVPAHPDLAIAHGLNVDEWADLALVDMIIASPDWMALDWEIDCNAWTEAVKGRVPVLPSIDFGSADARWMPRRVFTDARMHRGWADAMHYTGFKDLYLFNYQYGMDCEAKAGTAEEQTSLKNQLKTGFDQSAIDTLPRSYIPGFTDTSAPALTDKLEIPCDPFGVIHAQLPAFLMTGNELTIRMGQSAHKASRALLRLELDAACPLEGQLDVTAEMNGIPLQPPRRVESKEEWISCELQFDVPASALKPGLNTIRFSHVACEYQQVIDGLRLDVE